MTTALIPLSAFQDDVWPRLLSFGMLWSMSTLFVDKSIQINAPASRVWDALTERACTDAWAAEFSSGGPEFHIESDWKLGSPVLWKGQDGSVIVEGTVTALEPKKLLRFTVSDTRGEKALMREDDGITYQLTEHDGPPDQAGRTGTTTLRLLQGDFSAMADGEKYCRLSAQTWDRVLPVVKEWAEKKH